MSIFDNLIGLMKTLEDVVLQLCWSQVRHHVVPTYNHEIVLPPRPVDYLQLQPATSQSKVFPVSLVLI